MGQVPWLQSLLQMLPQKGPIETFHKVRPQLPSSNFLDLETQFTENKVEEIKSRAPKDFGCDILGTLVLVYLSTFNRQLLSSYIASAAIKWP
jgi:hypothetical protein